MDAGEIRYGVTFDNGAFYRNLSAADAACARVAGSGGRHLDKLGTAGRRAGADIGDGISSGSDRAGASIAAMAGKAALIAGLTMTVKAGVTEASKLQEALGLNERIFERNAESQKKWAEGSAKAIGMSTAEAISLSSQLAGQGQSVGLLLDDVTDKSRKLSVLAADLGASFDVGTEDALMALRSGLSGEAEPLRRFNIFLSEAAIKSKALEMGLHSGSDAMSEQTKYLARYAIIMEKTTRVQGTFAAEQDGASGSLKIATAEFKNASAALMDDLLPSIAKTLKVAGGVVQWTADNEQLVKTVTLIAASMWGANKATAALVVTTESLAKAQAALTAMGFLSPGGKGAGMKAGAGKAAAQAAAGQAAGTAAGQAAMSNGVRAATKGLVTLPAGTAFASGAGVGAVSRYGALARTVAANGVARGGVAGLGLFGAGAIGYSGVKAGLDVGNMTARGQSLVDQTGGDALSASYVGMIQNAGSFLNLDSKTGKDITDRDAAASTALDAAQDKSLARRREQNQLEKAIVEERRAGNLSLKEANRLIEQARKGTADQLGETTELTKEQLKATEDRRKAQQATLDSMHLFGGPETKMRKVGSGKGAYEVADIGDPASMLAGARDRARYERQKARDIKLLGDQDLSEDGMNAVLGEEADRPGTLRAIAKMSTKARQAWVNEINKSHSAMAVAARKQNKTVEAGLDIIDMKPYGDKWGKAAADAYVDNLVSGVEARKADVHNAMALAVGPGFLDKLMADAGWKTDGEGRPFNPALGANWDPKKGEAGKPTLGGNLWDKDRKPTDYAPGSAFKQAGPVVNVGTMNVTTDKPEQLASDALKGKKKTKAKGGR